MAQLQQTILLIEDEVPIADTITYALRTEAFAVVWRKTGESALSAFEEQPVSLVILDIGLPDMSGFEVCRKIRQRGETPIIFLTARSDEVDRIVGLELGADDYMAKPFSPRELTARVRAVLRRTLPGTTADRKRAGINSSTEIWLHDEERLRLSYRGVKLDLTRNEYRLLSALLRRPGIVFTREQLMVAAWDEPTAAMDRTVDAHIKTLRAKLRFAAPDYDPIVTHRGFGYSAREE